MKLYVAVSNDEYELPIAVAKNREELSRLTGISVNSISCHISNAKRRHVKKQRIFIVDVEDD